MFVIFFRKRFANLFFRIDGVLVQLGDNGLQLLLPKVPARLLYHQLLGAQPGVEVAHQGLTGCSPTAQRRCSMQIIIMTY